MSGLERALNELQGPSKTERERRRKLISQDTSSMSEEESDVQCPKQSE